MLQEPFFNGFSLCGEHDTLPFDYTRALAIFSHYIRTFVEHLDESFCLGSLEAVGGEGSVLFLHL